MAAKYVRLDVYRDRKRKWRWRLVATNGKTIADGSEGYGERNRAIHGAEVALGLATLGGANRPQDGEVVFRDNEDDRGVEVRVLP